MAFYLKNFVFNSFAEILLTCILNSPGSKMITKIFIMNKFLNLLQPLKTQSFLMQIILKACLEEKLIVFFLSLFYFIKNRKFLLKLLNVYKLIVSYIIIVRISFLFIKLFNLRQYFKW